MPTAAVVTQANGPATKGTYLEGGLRVPAIISYPKELPQNVTRDHIIIAADWFFTILDLCQSPKPEGLVLDGQSIVELIKDADIPSPHKVLHWAWQRGWAIREGARKLICHGDEALQLFNLTDSKPEQLNHLSTEIKVAAKLYNMHRDWITEVTS